MILPMHLLFYGLLGLSLVLLWSRPYWWVLPFLLSLTFGLYTHQLAPAALWPIAALALSIFCTRTRFPLYLRLLGGVGTLYTSLQLILHAIPDIHNLQILNQALISVDAVPFNLYLNYDSSLIGLFILGLAHPLIRSPGEWSTLLKQTLPQALALIVCLIVLSIAFGFVVPDFKIPACTSIFLAVNLLSTCTAEEALFRGFIQRHLAVFLGRYLRFGKALAVLCASILFGLAHYPGGPLYVLLSTIAGIGYGTIYQRSERIEASILTHYLLNLSHFFCFTYPFLATALPT